MAARGKRKSRRKSQPATPGWVWMGFGLAIGLAVAAAIYVKYREPAPVAATPPAEPAPVRREATPAPVEEPPAEPGFQFYEMLPNFEVVIPERGDREVRPDSRATPVEAPGRYVLQAGSFTRYEDADRMKATLALLGITSRIERVSIDDDTYHRVRIGPIDDLEELNRMRARLRESRIEVMMIRQAQ